MMRKTCPVAMRCLALAVLTLALLRPTPAAAQVIQWPFVDGIAGVAAYLSGLFNLNRHGHKELTQAVSRHDQVVDTDIEHKVNTIKYGIDPGDTSCQLYTARSASVALEWYSKGVRHSMENGINSIAMSSTVSPERKAVGWLYRLCKSGQLRRGTPAANFTDSDFGQAWFDGNRCIEDRTQAHAFLRPSTILENPVLVPPNQAQMEVLNNPAIYDPVDGGAPHPLAGTPAQTWARLTDKQKLFVGAKLFCENLAMGWITPLGMTTSEASNPDNMLTIRARMNTNGQKNVAADLCRLELTRRTAPDPDAPENAGVAAMAEIRVQREKVGNFLLDIAGKNPEDILAYSTNPVTGTIIPGSARAARFISPYLIERYAYDYCNNIQVAEGFNHKSGTAAEHTALALDCLEVAMNWEFNEIAHRMAFAQGGRGMADPGSESKLVATPVKTRYNNDHDAVPEEFLRVNTTLQSILGDRAVPLGTLLRMTDPSRPAQGVRVGSEATP